MYRPTVAQRLESYLRPVVLETAATPFNPKLEVCVENGRVVLNATTVNYSFGALHAVFAAGFRELDVARRNPQTALVLGLGAGSVPALLPPWCRVTGVELDPEVVRLAGKWFGLRPSECRTIVTMPAQDFWRVTA